MQTYFKCEEGAEVRANQVLIKSAKKRVVDMHHEVKYQCAITYSGEKLGRKLDKKRARQITMTREQYIEVVQ
jgi:hypothetical protein